MTKQKIDLRNDYEDKTPVRGGVLYRKGVVNQVWWKQYGPETWIAPNPETGKDNFDDMAERWAQ